MTKSFDSVIGIGPYSWGRRCQCFADLLVKGQGKGKKRYNKLSGNLGHFDVNLVMGFIDLGNYWHQS